MNKESPSLFEVGELVTDNGVVGEEDTSLVVSLSMIRGGLIVMSGLSSGGKTEIVESASEAFPSTDVFEVASSTSPTALFEKADEMNSKRVHVYPDLESLPEHIEAMLKSHGEGKEHTHEWTETKGGRHLEGRTINPPDTMVVCIASDNQNLDLDDNPEFRNRGLIVPTDASEELTERVNERQADDEATLYEDNISANRAREIQRHLGNVPVDQYGSDESMGDMVNPCAPAIQDCDPVPTKFTEARRDFPRLLDFMRSVSLYNYPNRMKTVHKNGSPVFLVTPEDCWLAMKIFGEKMILSALNLRDEDMEIIRLMRADPSVGWTVSEMQSVLREQGKNITNTDVKRSFKAMKTKGYVRKEKNSSNVNEFFPSPFASAVDHQADIDWKHVVDETEKVVHKILPEDDAEEYVERFCRGDGLLATHPFTGETVNIVEDDEFETLVNEANEKMEEVMNESIYEDESNSSGEEGEETEPVSFEGSGRKDGLFAFEDSEGSGEDTSGTLV